MKDLSLFHHKNSLAAKMKKGIRSFCHSVVSTSTLSQRRTERDASLAPLSTAASPDLEEEDIRGSPLTLEEMISQLEQEEEAARKARLDNGRSQARRRMSSINSSDILRSASNALNQYPRFSLDGRDSMYRSTFRSVGVGGGRTSLCWEGRHVVMERSCALPPTLSGESVVWCKPGVVARLMGLDAVPVPVNVRRARKAHGATTGRQNIRRTGR